MFPVVLKRYYYPKFLHLHENNDNLKIRYLNIDVAVIVQLKRPCTLSSIQNLIAKKWKIIHVLGFLSTQ